MSRGIRPHVAVIALRGYWVSLLSDLRWAPSQVPSAIADDWLKAIRDNDAVYRRIVVWRIVWWRGKDSDPHTLAQLMFRLGFPGLRRFRLRLNCGRVHRQFTAVQR